MWVVTTMMLAVLAAGMLLVAFLAYRAADETPESLKRTAWGWAIVAVICAGMGVWTAWTAAFMMASHL